MKSLKIRGFWQASIRRVHNACSTNAHKPIVHPDPCTVPGHLKNDRSTGLDAYVTANEYWYRMEFEPAECLGRPRPFLVRARVIFEDVFSVLLSCGGLSLIQLKNGTEEPGTYYPTRREAATALALYLMKRLHTLEGEARMKALWQVESLLSYCR